MSRNDRVSARLTNIMGHEFGLRGAVLNIPLIVHGLKDVKPGVVTDTVGLVDIAPSILAGAGVEPGIELEALGYLD